MGKYIYCVVEKKDQPLNFGQILGVGKAPVHFCAHEALAAAVSDAASNDYPLTRENLIAHQQVIEQIMERERAVLPVSFGVVAEDEGAVVAKLLNPYQRTLAEELMRIDGKVELSLKALWLDMKHVFLKILEEDEVLKHRRDMLQGSKVFRDDAITIGQEVASAIESRKNRIKHEVLSLVGHLPHEYKETALLGEEMIFNLSFLVPEDNQEQFDTIVRNLDSMYQSENIYFKYLGPLPLFNFVNLPIQF
jgi:hypothetical protein